MADDKIVVEIVAKLDGMDAQLKQGERKIVDSTARMEAQAAGLGNRIGTKIGRAIVGAFAVAGLDRALENIVENMKAGEAGKSLGLVLGDGLVTGLRSIPVAGALGEIIAQGLARGFGDGQTREEFERAIDERRKRGLAVQDEFSSLSDRITSDLTSPTEKLQKELAKERAKLLSQIGNDPALQLELLPTIDAGIKARLDREAARNVSIDSFSTPLGEFRSGATPMEDKSVSLLEKIEQNTRPNKPDAGSQGQRSALIDPLFTGQKSAILWGFS